MTTANGHRGRPEEKKDPYCTWAINGFSRRIKNRYIGWCHANGTSARCHIEYLILKAMREAGVDIPEMKKKELT